MKNTNNIIEQHLRHIFRLDSNQLRYELGRFERHHDIGAELSEALRKGRFPKTSKVSVCIDDVSYTAPMLYENHHAITIYAAYSLLTQLREHPETVMHLKNGFKIRNRKTIRRCRKIICT